MRTDNLLRLVPLLICACVLCLANVASAEEMPELETRIYVIENLSIPDINSDSDAGVSTITILARRTPEVVDQETAEVLSLFHFDAEQNHLIVHNTEENLERLERLIDLLGV